MNYDCDDGNGRFKTTMNILIIIINRMPKIVVLHFMIHGYYFRSSDRKFPNSFSGFACKCRKMFEQKVCPGCRFSTLKKRLAERVGRTERCARGAVLNFPSASAAK